MALGPRIGGREGFSAEEERQLSRAVDLAEEVVSDYYRFSEDFWRSGGRYDLRTLKDLAPEEITDGALAHLIRCQGPDRMSHRPRKFFRICLQDHRIRAAKRTAGLNTAALLAYVVTHELIHVVRFARHDQLFEASEAARLAEESLVHELTGEMLGPLGLTGFEDVLSYTAPSAGGVVLDITRWGAYPAQRFYFKESADAHLRV